MGIRARARAGAWNQAGGERGSWGRLAEAGRWLLPVPRPLQEKRRGTGQRVKGPVSLDVYCAHLLLILQKSNN